MYLILYKIEKTTLILLLTLYIVKTTFSNFQEGFFADFPLNYMYTDFAHKISHTKPSYGSAFGTKISICSKKVGGMRP